MSTGLYVLEVVRFIAEKDGPNKWLCDNDECHIKNKCKECKND